MPDLKSCVLFTAVVTPFHPNGTIAFAEFTGLLREQESAGNGVVILGSTGEALALNENEKRAVIDHAVGMQLKVPVLVGVPGFQLAETREFLQFCESRPLDGYLMPVPLYAKPGKLGQTEWFLALLNSVSRPCMLYNAPSRAGVKLHADALRELAAHPNAWAVKEASGSGEEFSRYRSAAPNLAFYSGDDALLPDFAKRGAVGLVSVAGNAWPRETRELVERALAGRAEDCASLWSAASDTLFLASNPVPVKALLHYQGKIGCAAARPPLDSRDLASLALLLAADEKVRGYFRLKEGVAHA